MRYYVALVHKATDSDFGVSFPDFPGCISVGATLVEAAAMASEALSGHIEMMDDAKADVIAYLSFPKAHWSKLHSTNPIERLNKEVKRRADVVGIFPNEDSIKRLVGAILLEQNDEWQVQHRYMTLETMANRADEKPAALTQIAA